MEFQSILKSVSNGLNILHLFTNEKPTWGVTEMANALSLNKSTVSRLVKELVLEGFLEKNGSKYQLGISVLCLSGVVTSHLEIYREAKLTLHSLVNKVEETAHIAVLEDASITYLHKVECNQPVQLLSYIGKNNPATCTSSGKVLLAYQPDWVVTSVVKNGLPKCGPNSITDQNQLMKDLEIIRQNGYSICINELHDEVVSIAAPVRDYSGDVIAAVSIVGPSHRMNEPLFPYYVKEVVKAGKDISEKLGYIDL
ncbi:IclR family transcriptional regulator [Alkalihalobacillus sp. MEB130]|uniref:IclR family transcriptional regulator n=1 Tax=Alkalihalobacillus sp. MEB130 TaxID=2976704 RepID=UPI0028E09D0C|nr:IclR family transcriptional regulator [Alkalihalobacillus sp. MEB130]MDT8859699.1 IclR family transcriptional regulator [Alkalihalobacillus sp. MEB130]